MFSCGSSTGSVKGGEHRRAASMENTSSSSRRRPKPFRAWRPFFLRYGIRNVSLVVKGDHKLSVRFSPAFGGSRQSEVRFNALSSSSAGALTCTCSSAGALTCRGFTEVLIFCTGSSGMLNFLPHTLSLIPLWTCRYKTDSRGFLQTDKSIPLIHFLQFDCK